MKINDRFLDGSMIQGELTEKTDGPSPGTAVPDPAPAELPQVRHPKTDSVELKTNSFFNFDQAAKLDPSKTDIGKTNDVPAAMIPGVPFREKVELPKTLPNGTSVDSNIGSDPGFGRKPAGPNHMGIDMKGTTIKNQLDDALKLKDGGQSASTTAPTGGTVNFNQIGGSHAREDKTYHAGLKRPGMDKISAEGQKKDPNAPTLPPLNPYVPKTEPDTSPASNLGKTIYDNTMGRLTGKKWDEIWGTGTDDKKYTNPDAPEGTEAPVVTNDMLERAKLRMDANKRPSNEDLGQGVIDASKLSTVDPRLKLISNPNPEADSVTGNVGSIDVMHNANGPDTVNPNDPELGGGSEPIDPNRLK